MIWFNTNDVTPHKRGKYLTKTDKGVITISEWEDGKGFYTMFGSNYMFKNIEEWSFIPKKIDDVTKEDMSFADLFTNEEVEFLTLCDNTLLLCIIKNLNDKIECLKQLYQMKKKISK